MTEDKKEEQKQEVEMTAVESKKELGHFKRGDYMVHVFIQKGKQFIPEDKDETTLKAIIAGDVAGLTEYSSTKENVIAQSDSYTVWNDHMFFQLRDLRPEEVTKTNILLKVMNKGLLKNEVIGQFQFDISTVYFKDNHVIEHQWVALSNPDGEDFSQITGLLKVSIAVSGPGDEQVKLEAQTGPEMNQDILQAATAKKKFKQLKIRFIQGRDFPTHGFLQRSMDAMITCEYGGGKPFKTKVHGYNTDTDKVEFDDEFWIPIQVPFTNDRLILSVYDHEMFGDSIFIGSCVLSVKKMCSLGFKEGGYFAWCSVTGAPSEGSGEAATEMNKNPSVASSWKGQILCHISAETTTKPFKKVTRLDHDLARTAKESPFYKETDQYDAIFQVSQGIALPQSGKSYKIKFQVNKHSWTTTQELTGKEGITKSNYNRWSQRIPNISFDLPHVDPEDPNTEFNFWIYLMDDDKPVSYFKGQLEDYLDYETEQKYKWKQLKADQSVGEVENDFEAGMISFKLAFRKRPDNEDKPFDFNTIRHWKTGKAKKRLEAYKVRAYIFQCRDLPVGDEEGTSDPFISIWNSYGEDIRTETIEDTLNPIYMQALELPLDIVSVEEAPPLLFDIYDEDQSMFGYNKDFLGRATIYMKDAAVGKDDEIPQPRWHSFRFGDVNSPKCGQVLCSFSFVPEEKIFKEPVESVNLNSLIAKKRHKVEINVLGLRALESTGFVPVQKAFIKFNTKSLLPTNEGRVLENIEINPNEDGPNPNMNSLIEFALPLPEEDNYCPKLTCVVYDYMFKGLSQPQIGTFSIKLGQIKKQQAAERKAFNTMIEQIIQFLDQRLAGIEARPSLLGVNVKDIKLAIKPDESFLAEKTEEDVQDESNQLIATPEDKSLEQKEEIVEAGANDDVKRATALINKRIANRMSTINKNVARNTLAQRQSKKLKALEECQRGLKEDDGTSSIDNVKFPTYYRDEVLHVWKESPPPNPKLFRSVGHNNQKLITKLQVAIDPDLEENEVKKALAKRIREKLQKEGVKLDQPMVEIQRRLSNRHYRRFYPDELENNKDLFPQMPFQTIKIKRGRNRGNKNKSFFSKMWSGPDKKDASGQVDTTKIVGYFKSRINIMDVQSGGLAKHMRKQFISQIEEKMSKVADMINPDIQHHFKVKDLACVDKRLRCEAILNKIGIKQHDILSFLEDLAYDEQIRKQLTTKTQCIVRLYVLEASELASRDIGSESDPYLKVTYGDQVCCGRDDYQLNQPNPQLNKMFEFSATFPGAPPIIVEMMDYDDLFGDDLIGKTVIDLDDRFFNPRWLSLDEVPIEQRQLYHPSTDLSQGLVDLWVDVDPVVKSTRASPSKKWDITPEEQSEFELRLCIFNTKNIPKMDGAGMADVFIKAWVDDGDPRTEDVEQNTDTHFRCETPPGNASFNYRMLFDIHSTPDDKPLVLHIQAWDRDIISKNDVICAWELDITQLVKDAKVNGKPVLFQQKYYEDSYCKSIELTPEKDICPIWPKKDANPREDGFWIRTKGAARDDEGKLTEEQDIDLRIDLRVVPKKDAEKNPVGTARSDPNVEPYLLPPTGRMVLSFNPWTMLTQLCSAEVRHKIYCAVCILVCVALIVALIPMFFTDFIAASWVSTFSGGSSKE